MLQFLSLLSTWLFSWIYVQKLSSHALEQKNKLIEYIAAQMLAEQLELTASAKKQIQNPIGTYVRFVIISYPKESVPDGNNSPNPNVFLSMHKAILQMIATRCICKTKSVTGLSIKSLEEAWENYSSWRESEQLESLTSETWRAFHHLLGYRRNIS